jgi:acetyl esterase
MPLDRDIAGLLQMMKAAGYPPLDEGTVEQARAGLRTLMVDLRNPATLVPVGAIENRTIAGGIPARVYRPASAGPHPTVVYFHGGGFTIGDLDTHDGACRLLCRDAEAVVVSVAYRLAPEHRFPAAVEDAVAATRWAFAEVDTLGGDAGRIAVGGDSAGGNLAAVAAQQAHADGLRLAAQMLLYPTVDMLGDYRSRTKNADGYFLTVADMHWFGEQYTGLRADDPRAAEVDRDPRLSPIRAESLAGLAPAVVATAEFDPLRDEGEAYAAKLAAAGVPVEHRRFSGLVHGFYGMELISPAAADAMAWCNAQLKALVG